MAAFTLVEMDVCLKLLNDAKCSSRNDMELTCEFQHKLLTAVTDNRPLLELIREVKAEVTVEEKDIDVVDLEVNFVLYWSSPVSCIDR